MTATAPVITVDGPSGAGKGTLCKALAESLGWRLLDSGAIYRVLALAALHHQVDITSEEALVPLAAHLDVRFVARDGKLQVILEGEDVSNEIRTETVGNTASQAAAFPRVREALLRRQRAFREAPGLIADGATWARWCSRTRRSRFSSTPARRSARTAACCSCRRRALMLTLNVF